MCVCVCVCVCVNICVYECVSSSAKYVRAPSVSLDELYSSSKDISSSDSSSIISESFLGGPRRVRESVATEDLFLFFW